MEPESNLSLPNINYAHVQATGKKPLKPEN